VLSDTVYSDLLLEKKVYFCISATF